MVAGLFMPTSIPPEIVAFANQLADIARPLAMEHFRTPLGIQWKADASPVTIADRTIERALREAIASRFPAHGILGEEEEAVGLEREWIWVVDPIDGTVNYVQETGKVQKCDLCDGKPACAEACPTGAITYVDANWTGIDKMKAWADKLGNQAAA